MNQKRRTYIQERITVWDAHVVRAAGAMARRPCNRATASHAMCVTNAARWRERLTLEENGEPPGEII